MPRSLPLLVIGLLLVGNSVAVAADETTSHTASSNLDPITQAVRERILRMTDFFDTVLPGTLGEHNLALHFSPKFGDFRDHEYVRYPVEVRYGATDSLELIAGMSPFSPNPINSGRDHRWGPGEARLGARYDLDGPLFFYDRATIGVDNRIPMGRPPVPLNEGYTHIRPWLATSRVLRSHPDTTFYTNFSYDREVNLTHRGPPPPEVTRRNIAEVAPGLLYKPAELGYFVEYRFRHFQEPTDWHLGHEVRIGTIWDVPIRRSAEWHLPGKWQVEIAYRVETEEGHKTGQGVTARVNWRTTLREVMNHMSGNQTTKSSNRQ
jgi:hypothetical protein